MRFCVFLVVVAQTSPPPHGRLAVGTERFCGLAVFVHGVSEIRDSSYQSTIDGLVLRNGGVAVPGGSTIFRGMREHDDRKRPQLETSPLSSPGGTVCQVARPCSERLADEGSDGVVANHLRSHFNLNRLLAQVISPWMASVPRVDVTLFLTRFVPYPRKHFMLRSSTPIISSEKACRVQLNRWLAQVIFSLTASLRFDGR